MGNQKLAGIALDPVNIQTVVDGLVCRAPPSRVAGMVDAAFTAATNPALFVYCHLWTGAERAAFWKGFLERIDEFAVEIQGYFVWFKSAFLMGEKDGDFAKAWEGFASGIGELAKLAWKVVVVTSGPPLSFHPDRAAYAEELKRLGLQITKEFIDGYQKAYKAGGIPQCTGRVFADLLRLAFEILGAKGVGKVAASAGKLAASGKITEVLKKLPGPLKKLPEELAKPPTKWQLMKYIEHDKSFVLYGRGIVHDLKPGKHFLVRVEATHPRHLGNWYHGPFTSREQAQAYAKYLADMGKEGIRDVNALPSIWETGSEGNAVEVVRIYKVAHETPGISSVVAPQKEGVARAATGGANAAKDAAPSKVRPGQGQQLSIPLRKAKEIHGIDLVEADHSIPPYVVPDQPVKK